MGEEGDSYGSSLDTQARYICPQIEPQAKTYSLRCKDERH